MDKKELTEAFKIIYDSLSEGKDSAEEIKKLEDDLSYKNSLISCLLQITIANIKNTKLNPFDEIAPFEVVRYIKAMIDNCIRNNIQPIDEKFIQEIIKEIYKLGEKS